MTLPLEQSFTKVMELSSSEIEDPKARWKSEAMTMLRSDQAENIYNLLICALPDKQSRRNALETCCTIQQLHIFFARLTMKPSPSELNKPQLVERIVRLVEPLFPLGVIDFSWTLEPSLIEDLDVKSIAVRIEDGSCALLSNVRPTHYWRHALGYSEPIIDSIVNQHTALTYKIRGYLQDKPDFRGKFDQLELILQTRSPLAHQVVKYGLAPNTPTNFCVDLLCEPFELAVHQGFDAICRKIPVLARRFERFWHWRLHQIYQSRFTTETHTYDTLLEVKAQDYAKGMTYSDIDTFERLAFQPHGTPNPAHALNQNHLSFVNDIAECSAAYPTLQPLLCEIAKEFRDHRNWFRLYALYSGIGWNRLNPTELKDICPGNSYPDWRTLMNAQPGLPSPFPYEGVKEDWFKSFSSTNVRTLLTASIGTDQLSNK